MVKLDAVETEVRGTESEAGAAKPSVFIGEEF